ncbi:MAG: (2Fe-2S)-binding protein [Fidelibacterota bacterium]|nr:MAG: (2Fe-2S)-binding protein [Candidatus Neomarinimicrobiota bacterium]
MPENWDYFDLTVRVNGQDYRERIPTHLRLLDFLRDVLHLTGTKEVCGEGECGACTVLLDGMTVNSCLVLAVEAHDSEVVTIEGVAEDEDIAALQQVYIDHHAIQCGYCTPGFVLSAAALLRDEPEADPESIRKGLVGNFCRCTGYQKIVQAISDFRK